MKTLTKALLGCLSMVGMSSQASALNFFDINPDSINGNLPGTDVPFTASSISGVSSGLINLNSTTKTATENGWLNLTSYLNGPNTVNNSITGLGGVSYQLFIDFNLSATYDASLSTATGGFGKNGSGYSLDTLTFTMYADPTNNTTFTSASSAGAGTNASFAPAPLSDLITIATGSLTSGQAFINAGGVSVNALTTFNLASPAGTNYFISPRPFYNLFFNAFNNTTGQVSADYNTATGCTSGVCQIAVITGVSTLDPLANNVPEPVTLELLGISMLGLGASRLRRTFEYRN